MTETGNNRIQGNLITPLQFDQDVASTRLHQFVPKFKVNYDENI